MSGIRFYWLVLSILCVWRITHLLHAEDGPGDLFVRLRRRAGGGFWGRLLDCFYCLSMWVALPFAYLAGVNWKERLFLWLASSAGAILLESARVRAAVPPPAVYYEEGGEADGVLWQGERAASGDEPPAPGVQAG
jgi:Protein of unknown function (DUF1360)